MNNNWFIAKITFTRQNEDGSFKRVTEPHMFNAVSFSDVETRIHEELGSIIRGEFVVKAIAREDLMDIFHYEDSDTWYKCKVATQDPDSEKSKVVNNFFYISAHSVKEATERLIESLGSTLLDYEIKAVVLSPVVDVFPYAENLDREISRYSANDVRLPVEGAIGEPLTPKQAAEATYELRVQRLIHEGFKVVESPGKLYYELHGEILEHNHVYCWTDEEFEQALGDILFKVSLQQSN